MSDSKKQLNEYFEQAEQWQAEQKALRKLLRASGLTESYKWKQPCYVHSTGQNVAIIAPFKNECRLGFFKGALLKDTHNMLHSPGKNSQSSRELRFTSVAQIKEQQEAIEQYIQQAIAVEDEGKQVEMKATADYEVPAELSDIFGQNQAFKDAFDALTPGRQRGYLLHFGGAKKSETRTARIENSMDKIFAGKGMQDCICGKSKKYPRCDGSHSK